uniref:Uncharacterized protein n=1 Tax=Arundo donax TaxID=35708 RepID=A0A0A9BBU4_ARUDO
MFLARSPTKGPNGSEESDDEDDRLEFLPFSDGTVGGYPVSRVVYTLLLPWAADVARARRPVRALLDPAGRRVRHLPPLIPRPRRRRGRPPARPFVRRGAPGPGPPGDRGPAVVPHRVHRPFPHLPQRLHHAPRPFRRARQGDTQGHRPRQHVPRARGGRARCCGRDDVLPVGPVLPSGSDEAGLFKLDDAKYMEWLDTKPASSVVYVSFGSVTTMARE